MKYSPKWFEKRSADQWTYYDTRCVGQGSQLSVYTNSSCTTRNGRQPYFNDTGGECMNNTDLKIYSTCIGGEVKAYRPGAGPDEQVTATGTGESFPMWGIGLLLLVPGLAFIILYMVKQIGCCNTVVDSG